MTLTEILEELPKLTPAEHLTIIEAALELIRKELPQESQQSAWSEEQRQIALAAEALLPDYEAGGDLTAVFTTIDGADFHASERDMVGEPRANARSHEMGIVTGPWNKEKLFARLEEICSPEGVQAARRLYSFAEERGATFNPWNKGKYASATARFRNGTESLSIFAIEDWHENGKSWGKFVINFGSLVGKRGISTPLLSRLAETLRTIPGVKERYVGLEEKEFSTRPSLFIDEILTQPGVVEKIQSAIDDLLQSISRYSLPY